jgi:hypothetical protein
MRKLVLFTLVCIISTTMYVGAQSLLQKAKNKMKGGESKEEYTKEDNGEGITGPLHEKYMGQIVFASEKLTRTLPESSFKTTFTLGEPIYCRAYIPRGIGDYYVYDSQGKNTNYSGFGTDYSSRIYAMAYADGVLLMDQPVFVDDLMKNDAGKFLTTYQIFFFRAANDEGNDLKLVNALNKLTDGEHKIRIESFAGTGPTARTSKQPIAVGEFTLIKKGSVKLNRSFADLKAGMKDPALEAKILKAVQAHARKNGWKENFSKVKISSEGWTIQRNSLTGAVLSRTVSAWAYAVWPDGRCSYQDISVKQDHDGKNFMDNTYFEGVGTKTDCDCN